MIRPPPRFMEACRQLGWVLDPALLDRCAAYLELLLEANRNLNLTAIRDPDEAWMRHILESLSLAPELGDARLVLDLGSGGGAPGIPLALRLPDCQFILLEATRKKAVFLETACARLGLAHVRVVNARAETLGRDPAQRAGCDAVVARAVAPLRELLELALPLLREGGRLLALKGRAAAREIAESGRALAVLGGDPPVLRPALPGLDVDTALVVVVKSRPTPPDYPRAAGQAGRHPL